MRSANFFAYVTKTDPKIRVKAVAPWPQCHNFKLQTHSTGRHASRIAKVYVLLPPKALKVMVRCAFETRELPKVILQSGFLVVMLPSIHSLRSCCCLLESPLVCKQLCEERVHVFGFLFMFSSCACTCEPKHHVCAISLMLSPGSAVLANKTINTDLHCIDGMS